MKSLVALAVFVLLAPLFAADRGDGSGPAPASIGSAAPLHAGLAGGPSPCPPPDFGVELQNDGGFGCDAPNACQPGDPGTHTVQPGAAYFGTLVPVLDSNDVWAAFPTDPGTPVLVQMTPAPAMKDEARAVAPAPDFDLVGLDAQCRPIPDCESHHEGAQPEMLQCFLPPHSPWLVVWVEPKPMLLPVPPPPQAAAGLAAPSPLATPAPGGGAPESSFYCDPMCMWFGYAVVQFG